MGTGTHHWQLQLPHKRCTLSDLKSLFHWSKPRIQNPNNSPRNPEEIRRREKSNENLRAIFLHFHVSSLAEAAKEVAIDIHSGLVWSFVIGRVGAISARERGAVEELFLGTNLDSWEWFGERCPKSSQRESPEEEQKTSAAHVMSFE